MSVKRRFPVSRHVKFTFANGDEVLVAVRESLLDEDKHFRNSAFVSLLLVSKNLTYGGCTLSGAA